MYTTRVLAFVLIVVECNGAPALVEHLKDIFSKISKAAGRRTASTWPMQKEGGIDRNQISGPITMLEGGPPHDYYRPERPSRTTLPKHTTEPPVQITPPDWLSELRQEQVDEEFITDFGRRFRRELGQKIESEDYALRLRHFYEKTRERIKDLTRKTNEIFNQVGKDDASKLDEVYRSYEIDLEDVDKTSQWWITQPDRLDEAREIRIGTIEEWRGSMERLLRECEEGITRLLGPDSIKTLSEEDSEAREGRKKIYKDLWHASLPPGQDWQHESSSISWSWAEGFGKASIFQNRIGEENQDGILLLVQLDSRGFKLTDENIEMAPSLEFAAFFAGKVLDQLEVLGTRRGIIVLQASREELKGDWHPFWPMLCTFLSPDLAPDNPKQTMIARH